MSVISTTSILDKNELDNFNESMINLIKIHKKESKIYAAAKPTIRDSTYLHGVKGKDKFRRDDRNGFELKSGSHFVCKECFKRVLKIEYDIKHLVDCPEGGKIIHQDEITRHLGQDEWEEIKGDIDDMSLVDFKKQIKGRCGNFVKRAKRDVNYGMKNEEGEVISPESAEHLARYKTKCKECKDDICAKCKISPYHAGFTCSKYREFLESDRCRFCKKSIKARRKGGAFKYTCKSLQCKYNVKECCDKKLPCGHYCLGVKREPRCIPCLDPEGVNEDEALTLGQNASSNCVICVNALGEQPCVQLECGHLMHVLCLLKRVELKWNGPRVHFSYKDCPSCKMPIDGSYHIKMNRLLQEGMELEYDILLKSIEHGRLEGIDKDQNLKDPNDLYYDDYEGYAMDKLAFYICYKCNEPYYGGLRECGQELEVNANFKKNDYVGSECNIKRFKGKSNCDIHGSEYIEWKCRYGGNYSQWFGFGNTHFCSRCHSNLTRKIFKCPGKPECNIEMEHPDDGTEFAMGCGMCKNEVGADRV